MTDNNRHKRALEEVSHFFLSGDESRRPSGNRPETQGPIVPPDTAAMDSLGDGPKKSALNVRIAHPVDTGVCSKKDIVQAVEGFLRSNHPEHLVTMENIGSSRFGTSDLVLFNKRNMHILCARIHQGKKRSDFLISSLAYGAWLEETLNTSTPFFSKSPRLFLYLFSDNYPSSATHTLKQMTGASSICLVRYHVLQVPDEEIPIVYFRFVFPSTSIENRSNTQKDSHFPGISKEEWRTFNRLKERALEN